MTAWLELAETFNGLSENPSVSRHNPKILEMLYGMGKYNGEAKAWWKEDETPWCGLFVAYVLGETGRWVVKEWYRAKSWASPDMTKLSKPAVGSIAVMSREGGGHVCIVAGVDQNGNIMCWGGNQSDKVCLAAFAPSRIDGYYWPSKYENKKCVKSTPLPERYKLPLIRSNGKVSTNEA